MATIPSGKAVAGSFLLIVLFNLIHVHVSSQPVVLPENSKGKVEYYNSVETDSVDYFTLWDKAIAFLDSLSVPDQLTREVQSNEQLTELTHQFGFYLFIKPTLTRQIDGVVIADISICIEDTMYQYRINNIRFIKYARDRFGKFVPKSSKTYPLELYYPDSKTKTWKAHFAEINGKIVKLQHKLEAKMIE
jgi:hypothetical protein